MGSSLILCGLCGIQLEVRESQRGDSQGQHAEHLEGQADNGLYRPQGVAIGFRSRDPWCLDAETRAGRQRRMRMAGRDTARAYIRCRRQDGAS